jgi:hypothetical protein
MTGVVFPAKPAANAAMSFVQPALRRRTSEKARDPLVLDCGKVFNERRLVGVEQRLP